MRNRKQFTSAIRQRILTAAAFAITLLCFSLLAAPLRAAEEHLPEKARVVAEKFAAYKKIATPLAVEAKRKQVVEYLGSLLKQEAAAANLDRAIAVKELIEKIERGDVKKPAPTPTPRRPTGSMNPKPAGYQLTRFAIRDDASRTLEFPFEVATQPGFSPQAIVCEIGGASDDSGDGGLHYELVDPSGKVAKKGFLDTHQAVLVVHQTRSAGTWKLVIIDGDTALRGDHPGNTGTVKIDVGAHPSNHTALATAGSAN